MMQTRPKPSSVIFAKDVGRLADFYKAVICMIEIAREKDHVVLECDGFQLVIHGIPKGVAARIVITAPPEVRKAAVMKICLPVETIKQARDQAKVLGGHIGAKASEWEARGFRACDGYDPEGNVFQVREGA